MQITRIWGYPDNLVAGACATFLLIPPQLLVRDPDIETTTRAQVQTAHSQGVGTYPAAILMTMTGNRAAHNFDLMTITRLL